MSRNTPLNLRIIPFCEREHVKRSLSPAIFGVLAFVIEFIGVFRPCNIVRNTYNEIGIGLNNHTVNGECADYERGYKFDHFLFAAKVMSGASLTVGGLALIMTIVCQFLWAGMFFWKCLAFWKAMSAVMAGCIFVIFNTEECYDNNGNRACELTEGGQLVCVGAAFWFLSGMMGLIFPPPEVPDDIRPVTTLGTDAMNVNVDKDGPSPFSGVSY